MASVWDVRKSIGAVIALKIGVLLLFLMMAGGALLIHQFTVRLEEAAIDKARATVRIAARQYGDMFDNAIDAGLITVAEVFDTNYQEIKGWDWKEKPKFHTKYDALCDRSVLVFQDKILETGDYIYALGVDVNGYSPTHNTKGQRPLDGSSRDLLENRTKRIWNSNPTEVNRAKNVEPFLLQVYHRDTGEVLWDASAPIWVKGKHWGGFILGVSLVQLEARKRELGLQLAGVFCIAALATLFAVYFLVQQAIRPVVQLTEVANQISLGEGLETPLTSNSRDEIGLLTKSIERLRVSMQAAMKRLG